MKHIKCPGVKSANNFSLYNLRGVTYYAVDYPILTNCLGFLFISPQKLTHIYTFYDTHDKLFYSETCLAKNNINGPTAALGVGDGMGKVWR